MPLPKIDQPVFSVKIPSTNKKTTFRPFTVKEEKILMVAQESKDAEQMILALRQIIDACVDNIDVDKLSTFDNEYLLLKIRSKAVDSIIDFQITDPDTEEKVSLSLNLDEVEVEKTPDHKNIIEVNDSIKLVMRYPTLSMISNENSEDPYKILMSCIESIIQNEEDVYNMDDFTEKEKNEFVDSLGSATLKEMKTFFDTMPKVRHVLNYKLKDGTEKEYVLEGMESFFI